LSLFLPDPDVSGTFVDKVISTTSPLHEWHRLFSVSYHSCYLGTSDPPIHYAKIHSRIYQKHSSYCFLFFCTDRETSHWQSELENGHENATEVELQARVMGLPDAEDTLSMVRTAQASRLRRRGAIRHDVPPSSSNSIPAVMRYSLHTPHALADGSSPFPSSEETSAAISGGPWRILCGALRQFPAEEEVAYYPSPLPDDLISSGALLPHPKLRLGPEPRTNGCSAILYTGAIPSDRLGFWVGVDLKHENEEVSTVDGGVSKSGSLQRSTGSVRIYEPENWLRCGCLRQEAFCLEW